MEECSREVFDFDHRGKKSNAREQRLTLSVGENRAIREQCLTLTVGGK